MMCTGFMVCGVDDGVHCDMFGKGVYACRERVCVCVGIWGVWVGHV